ncbi:MAG: hypothetical protein Q9160_007346 [Pyrenula sp. 1 TL-2023]
MLARRFIHPTASPTSLFLRSFSSTPYSRDAPGRSPGLGDITPTGADQFNARQTEFRDNLEAARKQKEQADSQSFATDIPQSPSSPPDAASEGRSGAALHEFDAATTLDPASLGSLATHRGVGEARKAESENNAKRGALSNLIYGTHEGRNMDKDIEKSFSQVLARGKYVHSIVFHEVKPDKVDEYVQLVGDWYPKMAGMQENKVNLVGSWRTEVGDCDTFGTSKPSAQFTRGCVDMIGSSYMGISALRWISFLSSQYFTSSRVYSVRQASQITYKL